jgi:dTDP-4-dehydrorhamnose reductase
LAEATTRILAGIIAGTKRQFDIPEVSGIYHMTAAGQTTWYEFAKAILEEARRAPQDLPWLASTTKGRPLIARRVLPIATEEFHSPTRRPAYSVLSNARLMQTFGVTLPDWRTQLQKCFSSKHIPANSSSVVSSREKTQTS